MQESGDQTPIPEGLRVLLVEDDHALAAVAADMLTSMGCHVVHSASSAESAMVWLGEGGEADMLITDIVMPGMNGIDLACHVRRVNPDMPVLLATGYSDDIVLEQRRRFPVLVKPYCRADIRAAIGDAIGRA